MPDPGAGAPPLFVIAGSTATGKTGLSLALARALRDDGVSAEIISADSRQVFRVDFPLASGIAAFWQASIALFQAVQIVQIFVQQAQGGLARMRQAVAGNDRLCRLDQRRQARQRGAVDVERPAG